MAFDLGAEVPFVLPLDFGHVQKTVDECGVTARRRVTRGVLVLTHVAALEAPRAVHRQEPTADGTEHPKRLANDLKDPLPGTAGACSEPTKHLADQLAMVPFLTFNGADAVPFLGTRHRSPVAAVREASRELARIRGLQRPNEALTVPLRGPWSILSVPILAVAAPVDPSPSSVAPRGMAQPQTAVAREFETSGPAATCAGRSRVI